MEKELNGIFNRMWGGYDEDLVILGIVGVGFGLVVLGTFLGPKTVVEVVEEFDPSELSQKELWSLVRPFLFTK
jgi:hypothetical protein